MPSPSPAIEPLAETLRPVAVEHPEVLALYLFGSRAQGEEHPGSDIDLGVLLDPALDLWQRLGLQARFDEVLSERVDLVDLGSASPYLALDIVRGERLYCRDPEACDHFELYVLRRAADLAPFERQRRRAILNHETVRSPAG